jgi:hypothetical protein
MVRPERKVCGSRTHVFVPSVLPVVTTKESLVWKILRTESAILLFESLTTRGTEYASNVFEAIDWALSEGANVNMSLAKKYYRAGQAAATAHEQVL